MFLTAKEMKVKKKKEQKIAQMGLYVIGTRKKGAVSYNR